MSRYFFLAAALVSSVPGAAVEIATGRMLGSGYEPRAFYMRQGGGAWRKTCAGPQFRPEAAGRMMNLRVAQALFDDEWLTEARFDPEANTRRVIQALDTWRDHGILAISVSLQGGNAGYGVEAREIPRSPENKPGPGKGALISAFRPDGSLKEAWMKRALALARELDRRGMVLNLICFYQRQDEVLESPQAIHRGLLAVTGWLMANNLRNVIVEIANEHDVSTYDHGRYIHNEMGRLIEMVRGHFRAGFRVPVTASTGGSMRVYDGVLKHGDLVVIHGNNRTVEAKGRRVAELMTDAAVPGPVYMNEDDNGRDTTPGNLERELAACDAVWKAGGSWGYMPWRQVQMFPFRYYMPSRETRVAVEMAPEQRDPAYFHAVLDHIRKLVLAPGSPACRLSQ